MIQDILRRRNQELLRDMDLLLRLLQTAKTTPSFEPYQKQIISYCENIIAKTRRTVERLRWLEQTDVSEDLLSETETHVVAFRILSAILTTPILRFSSSDELSSAFIQWLNTQHPQTCQYPPFFISGHWAVQPYIQIKMPIYFIPNIEQRGLLYQPLLFHEFGHVLYEYHRLEMDDLVGEFQKEVIDLLTPPSGRNDRYDEEQDILRQTIAYRWYSWIKELFCDAVGFNIGGPCFLHAVSSYLTTISQNDFYSPAEDLRKKSHPVTWLRVQLLIKRLAKEGFIETIHNIQDHWGSIAQVMHIEEDYHGFYDKTLDEAIIRVVDDMLIEASPRRFLPEEVTEKSFSGASKSPITLLNEAWHVYFYAHDEYPFWEKEQISRFLNVAPR